MKELPKDRGEYRVTLRCPDGLAIEMRYNALIYSAPNFILKLEEVTTAPYGMQDETTDFFGLIGRLRKRDGASKLHIDFNSDAAITDVGWLHVERGLEQVEPDEEKRRSFLVQARSGKRIEIEIVDPAPLTPQEEDTWEDDAGS